MLVHLCTYACCISSLGLHTEIYPQTLCPEPRLDPQGMIWPLQGLMCLEEGRDAQAFHLAATLSAFLESFFVILLINLS